MGSTRNKNVPRQNRILAALPRKELARLKPDLVRISLEIKQKLFEPNALITHVYFPVNGVVSLITIMKNGDRTEVATVGDEGMVGLPVFLGAKSVPIEAFSQIPGEVLRLEVGAFKRELAKNGRLRPLLTLYTQALLDQMSQSVSCNRVHNIDQRCCRWLLMCHDRVGEDTFSLTQEFLGQMLGVRRASVNRVATQLQREGLIRYRRGMMTIANRKGMEKHCCECYSIVKKEYDALLG